jgi:hypothetical protein
MQQYDMKRNMRLIGTFGILKGTAQSCPRVGTCTAGTDEFLMHPGLHPQDFAHAAVLRATNGRGRGLSVGTTPGQPGGSGVVNSSAQILRHWVGAPNYDAARLIDRDDKLADLVAPFATFLRMRLEE